MVLKACTHYPAIGCPPQANKMLNLFRKVYKCIRYFAKKEPSLNRHFNTKYLFDYYTNQHVLRTHSTSAKSNLHGTFYTLQYFISDF